MTAIAIFSAKRHGCSGRNDDDKKMQHRRCRGDAAMSIRCCLDGECMVLVAAFVVPKVDPEDGGNSTTRCSSSSSSRPLRAAIITRVMK
mmetsp:Transcript_1609/g.3606  ORF Transcript_1609/g.3606 Transcript_1609/m.3606 type:complete len:89 (+) Transcript_1609:801-1067(+)